MLFGQGFRRLETLSKGCRNFAIDQTFMSIKLQVQQSPMFEQVPQRRLVELTARQSRSVFSWFDNDIRAKPQFSLDAH